jgi:hypothetical protein
MNVGLSNLNTLKSWLLPAAMRTGTDYDTDIERIGKGVAGLIERHCNRTLERAAGTTYVTSADRSVLILNRYPVETVASIELREDLSAGWQSLGAVNSILTGADYEKGILHFGTIQSTYMAQLRVTFTGGYWFEELEPTDIGYPTAQPAGSTALPDDVRLAWLLQCEHVWAQRDKLGLNIANQPSEIYSGALVKIELLPVVKEHLRTHVRYSML